MIYIYRTTNIVNGKYYIGVHEGEPTDEYLGSGIVLSRAIQKYGKVSFRKEVLCEFDSRIDAFNAEREMLKGHLDDPLCYNVAEGGCGGVIGKLVDAQERGRRTGTANKGRALSSQAKTNIALALTGHAVSLETKLKQSAALVGKVKSEVHRQRLSEARLGTVDNDATREKKKQAGIERVKNGKDMGLMRGKHYPKIECPHCHLLGGNGAMKRYHFDNCKDKYAYPGL